MLTTRSFLGEAVSVASRIALALLLTTPLLQASLLHAADTVPVSQLSEGSDVFSVSLRGTPGPIDQFLLSGPARLVIDVQGTQVDTSSGNSVFKPSNSSAIARIRLGNHPGPKARIVLDLADTEVREASDFPHLVVSVSANQLKINVQDGNAEVQQASFSSPISAENEVAISDEVAIKDGGSAPAECSLRCETQADPTTGAGPSMFSFGKKSSSAEVESTAGRDVEEFVSREGARGGLFVSRALLESGWADAGEDSGLNTHLQFVAGFKGDLTPKLSYSLAARVDGQYQSGDLQDLDYLRLDYDEAWLRYSGDNLRVTIGAQRIVWGRADEFAPTDRLSTRDFTRLILDDLEYRRRANPALRLQWLGDGGGELDFVFLPTFIEAELPPDESVWFPVDSVNGTIAGLPLGAGQSQALMGATVDNDFSGSEGFGLRYSSSGSGVDYAVSLQRVNNPEPYFTLARPPTASSPAEIAVVYPRTWVVGGDAAFSRGQWTFRGELAWLSDSPYTSIVDSSLQTTDEFNWALGAEVFPGDGDLRLTLQISGRHLIDASEPLDFENITTALGALETPLLIYGSPFVAKLRYSVRLDERGTYLNPELSFTAWEPSEIYLGAHLFSGDSGTLEAYYSERDTLVLGWRAKF